MLTIRLLLLFALQGVSSYHFSLTAHWSGIQHHDVKGIEKDHLSFQPHEQRLYDMLKSLLNDDLHEFFIDNFEIHGSEFGKQSAIMKAYLSSPLDAETVIQKIVIEVSVLHMLEIDELPKRSIFVGYPTNGINSCTNSGVILPNRTCACQPFTGGQSCEVVLCQNQGLENFGSCLCPPGYSGRYCEPQACVPPSTSAFTVNQQEFILAVNSKISMAYVLNTLLLEVGDVLDRINKTSPNLFTTWTVINYIVNDELSYAGSLTFYNPLSFLHYLTGIRLQPGFDRQATLFALDTLSVQVVKSSNIFVFTDSLIDYPEENNYTLASNTNESLVTMRNFAWRNKPANQPLNTTDDGYLPFRRVAQALHGDVVTFDQREIETVMPLLSEYVLHENIAVRYSVSETTAQTIPISSDSKDQNVSVLVTVDSDGKLPDVKTNNGVVLTPAIQGKRFLFYHITSSEASSFVITGTTPWSFRAFVHSPSTAYISYSLEDLFDGGDSVNYAELFPIINVAHYGSQASDFELTFLDLQSGLNSSTSLSSTTRSQQCTFQYSFDKATDNCTPGPYAQQVSYTEGQNQIVRILPGLCMSIGTHKEPDYVCLNNGTFNGFECECTYYFDGTHCEEVACLNYGTVNPFPGNGQPYCLCKEGFEGDHCEILSCSQSSNETFNIEKRTLSFVLQSSMSQAYISSNIQQGLGILLNQTSSKAYDQFLLTTFNSVKQGGVYNDQMRTDPYSTAYAFSHAVSMVHYTASNADDYAVYDALMDSIKMAGNKRSSFFFFVDTPFRSVMNNETGEMDVLKALIESQHEITIVITPRFGMTDLCMTEEETYPALNLAKVSGGQFLNLCQLYGSYENDPIVEMFTGYGLIQNEFQLADATGRAYSTNPVKMLFQPAFDSVFYAVVNSDKTENFTLTYNDGTDDFTLNSVISMPFLSIYLLKVNLASGSASYINVQGAEGSSDGELFIKLLEKSEISVFLSYSPNPSIDNMFSSVELGSDCYPVVHLSDSNLTAGWQYSLLGADDTGFSNYFGESSSREDTCTYEKIFTNTYACSYPNSADIMKVIIATTDSREVTRAFRTFCYVPKDKMCLNGGSETNGTCKCTAQYSGEYCENPRCFNGNLNHKFECQCYMVYSGKFCEYESCENLNFWEFKETRGRVFRQLVLVLNTNLDQLLVNQQINALMQKVILYMFFSGDVNVYSLITFDEKDVTFVISTTNSKDFQAALQTATLNVNSKVGQNTKALDAIQLAYTINTDYPSIIYLFTGSDSAPAPASLPTLLKKRTNTQVNIVQTSSQTYPAYPGGPNGPTLIATARMLGGRILPITQGQVPKLDEALTYSTSANQLVLDTGDQDCTVPTTKKFYLENGITFLSVTVTGVDVGRDGFVVLISPNGTQINTPPIFKDNMAVVLYNENVNNTAGHWAVTVKTTTGSCYVQVRVQSQLIVIPAFTAVHHDDYDIKIQPFVEYVQNKATFVTFRVSDGGDPFQQSNNSAILEHFSLYRTNPSQPWTDVDIYDVSVTLRDRTTCSFQWISDSLWLSSDVNQKMRIFGKDAYGNMFERTFFFSVPDAADNASTCVNGKRTIFGECLCDKDHFGDYCIDRICKNNGFTSFGGSCVCPPGYFGPFCEDYFKE